MEEKEILLTTKILSTIENYTKKLEITTNKIELEGSRDSLDKLEGELGLSIKDRNEVHFGSREFILIENTALRHFIMIKLYHSSKPLEYSGLVLNIHRLEDEEKQEETRWMR